jgi:hypothetical protein
MKDCLEECDSKIKREQVSNRNNIEFLFEKTIYQIIVAIS